LKLKPIMSRGSTYRWRSVRSRIDLNVYTAPPLMNKCIILYTLLVGTAVAQFPGPVLDTIYPAGGHRNSTVEIQLDGKQLDPLRGMIFDHPGLKAELVTELHPLDLPPEPIPGRLRVKIGDVPPGIYNAQVFSATGLSNPRLFEVSTLNEIEQQENSLEKPQRIEMDSVINGRFKDRKIDAYSFPAKKGQIVVLDLMAERIDSRSDASMKLLNARGRELASARDTTYRDPVIYHTIPADGDYLAAVHDFAFTGGSQHIYRLKVSTRPSIRAAIPPALLPGETRTVTLLGANLPGEQVSVEIQAPRQAETCSLYRQPAEMNNHGFLYYYKDAEPFWIPLATAAITVAEEQSDRVQPMHFPGEITGRFDRAGDSDDYSFTVKKGAEVLIEVFSHRMNLPTDPHLFLYKLVDKGGTMDRKFVGESDDTNPKVGGAAYSTAHRDPVYKLNADADATYIVTIGNRYQTAGPDSMYRLVLRQSQADFNLLAHYTPPLADPKKITLSGTSIVGAGRMCFTIEAERCDGFNSAIEIETQGLPEGFLAHPCTIPRGSNKGLLIIAAKPDAKPWAGAFQIFGKAKQELRREALGMTSVWPVDNIKERYHQKRLRPGMSLGLDERGQAALTIKASNDQIWKTCIAAKFELPIKYETTQKIKDKVVVKGLGLPQIKTPPSSNIEKNKNEGKLTWDLGQKNSPGLKAGTYQVVLRADGTFNYTPDPRFKAEAEERKARYEEYVKQAEEGYKNAQQLKSDADKGLAQVKKNLQQEKKESEEARHLLAEAEQKLKAAQQGELTEKTKLDRLKPMLDAAVKAAKNTAAETKPRDIKFAEFSTPITIHIAASPVTATPSSSEIKCSGKEKPEILVRIEKKFGFADKVELSLLPPKGLEGLKITQVTINKEEVEGRIVLETTEALPAGTHACELQAKYTFNNQAFDEKQAITLIVEARPQETEAP
jgi:hypothetical protein